MGNDRTLRLLRLIARGWAVVPAGLRRTLETGGRTLQLDERLTPSFAALAMYPVIDRIGPWWSLVFVFVPIVLWGHAVAGTKLSIRRQLIGVGAYFFVLFAAPLLMVWKAPSAWVRIGEFTGWTFRVGLYGLLFTTAVLALTVAFAWALTSRVAAAALGGGLAAVLVLSMFLGQLPGWSVADAPAARQHVGGWRGVALTHLAAAGVGATVFLLARRWDAPTILRRRFRRLLPAAAVTAWLVPAAFGLAALMETAEKANAVLYTGREFERGLAPQISPGTLTPDELAEEYRPLLLLHREERWPADSVDGYLKEVSLWRLRPNRSRGVSVPFDGERLPSACSGSVRENDSPVPICFVLVGDCPHVTPTCDRGRNSERPEEKIQGGRVYARVIVRGKPQRDGSPPVFRTPLPFPELHAVIQYWIFFRNDLWRADTGIGRIVQRHQSDWEHVTIGLSRTEPLFVGYSSHCGGTWLEWKDVQTSAGGNGHVRPVVWIARGSHATYPDPAPREPDFLSCRRSPSGARQAIALLTYAANIRETLPDTSVIQDPDSVRIDARTQPFSFPGRWTAVDSIALVNGFREVALPPERERPRPGKAGPRVSGPETPTCKPVWRDPLAIIFCGEHWEPRSRCTPDLDARRQDIRRGCV